MISISNSASIRNIENTYGINLTTCTRPQLDSLTSKHSSHRVITTLRDLMLDSNKFDLDNMTEIERANLKYLVMSTEELLHTLKKKVTSIYYKPCESRLRWLMSYNDFYQVCAYKLLLNDGILRFDANYKLDPAIHFWLLRTAMWQTHHKVSTADEVTILDQSCSDESETTIGDLMLKDDCIDLNTLNIDSTNRINFILSKMSRKQSNRLVFKANETVIPVSEYTLAKLFIVHRLGKKELSKLMFNKDKNQTVSNQMFNKIYKQTLMHIASLLSDEAELVGETFTLNEDEL